MDAIEALLTRRSIRQYTKEPIPADTIKTILTTAMSAPSARNTQPWHFLVADQRELIDQIPQVHPHANMCTQAAVVIITCFDNAAEEKLDYTPQDMANTSENILLAVRALDLGAVWLGVFPNEERIKGIQKLFRLPENIIPFNVIPIGHTDSKQEERPERFKPEKIHYNNW